MFLLRTERLVLRPLRPADAEDVFKVRGDSEAMRFWDWPHDEALDDTRRIVAEHVDDLTAGRDIYWVARTHYETFVGLFDLSDLASETPELGFMVPRSCWDQGHGREGADAVVQEAWRRGYPAVRARVHADNHRAARLLERLGFNEDRPAVHLEVRPGRSVLNRFFRRDRPDWAAV